MQRHGTGNGEALTRITSPLCNKFECRERPSKEKCTVEQRALLAIEISNFIDVGRTIARELKANELIGVNTRAGTHGCTILAPAVIE
ncbi:unnamed protein product [Schistosoma mattheei]|uniref:Uncharacterized protein n=1 Tax=Schistosoma mattheei TaxID=31246 RepID=A0A3P8FD17_9TREM|nr:unnamed protein product [Schistosoma mattheei]